MADDRINRLPAESNGDYPLPAGFVDVTDEVHAGLGMPVELDPIQGVGTFESAEASAGALSVGHQGVEGQIEEVITRAPRLPEGVIMRSHPYFTDVLPKSTSVLTEEERHERDDS